MPVRLEDATNTERKGSPFSLFRPHHPVENGCKTWNVMRFSELSNLLWASRESYGQQIQLHFDFSPSIKEKRLAEWQNSNYLALCVRVTR